MPPEGHSTITVPDEAFNRVTEVMIEYDCDSTPMRSTPHRLSHSSVTKQLWLSCSLNDSPNEPQNRKTALLR